MGILRFYLAMAVCLNHLTHIPGSTSGVVLIPDSFLAVEIFFAISGFYMTLILEEKYTGPGRLWSFYRNRALRLFPAYYIILISFILLSLGLRLAKGHWVFLAESAAMFSQSNWFTQVYAALANLFIFGQDSLFLMNYSQGAGGLCLDCAASGTTLFPWQLLVIPQSWSIEVEMLFYLVAPFLIRLRTKTVIAAIISLLAMKIVVNHFVTYTDYWSLRFPPFESLFFLCGIISYRVYKHVNSSVLNDFVMLSTTSSIFLFLALSQFLVNDSLKMIMACIVVPGSIPFIFKMSRNSIFDRNIGELSYPIYLAHYAVIQMVVYWYRGPHPVLFVAAVTFLISFALFRFILRPMESFRQVRTEAPVSVFLKNALRTCRSGSLKPLSHWFPGAVSQRNASCNEKIPFMQGGKNERF